MSTIEKALTRTERPRVRMAHMGLGAFHRAHQAWYTHRAATEGSEWGIAAFTGRSPGAAEVLAAQDGLYTLVERSAESDRAETIQSIVQAYSGADDAAWLRTLADPEVTVLTVTVTEAGYRPGATAPSRIAEGLRARRRAGAGPVSVISCDNLLGNGRALRAAVLSSARDSKQWIAENVDFVDTVVDRITPAVTLADIETVQTLTGRYDAAPVIAEPFSEWVVAGAFPAGRPAWDRVGARFVTDVAPYEERKLWLLNAGHTFLAAAGRLRGFETIDQAFADANLRSQTEALWAEQRVVVDLSEEEISGWLVELRTRFDNPRIAHSLEQIARDSALKVPQRILSAVNRREERGLGPGDAQRSALEAWVRSIAKFRPDDPATAAVSDALRGLPLAAQVETIIDQLTPEGSLS